jgi:MarR family transcriptional regulator for hemolysin
MQGFFQRYIMLYRPLISKLNDLLRKLDLSYSLWQIIFYLENYGSATLVEISNHYNVEKPTITRSVQKLEEKRIVEVIPGKDRREKIIRLTGHGEEIYQLGRKKITEFELTVMEGISLEKQKAAFEILPCLRENILKHKGDDNYE